MSGYRSRWTGRTHGMGWTHDFRDVSRNRRRTSNQAAAMSSIQEFQESQGRKGQAVDGNRLGAPLGIPRILGRRARWMTARLRHARSS
jgi:hypothetical protein